MSGLVLLDSGSEFLQDALTPAQWAFFVRGAKQPGNPRTLEAADYRSSVRALRAAPPAREITSVGLSADSCWFILPGFDARATCSAWLAAQDRLATLLDAGHIKHTNSGHFIQGENPELVINSIREVLRAARKKACTIGAKNHGQCVKAEEHARRS